MPEMMMSGLGALVRAVDAIEKATQSARYYDDHKPLGSRGWAQSVKNWVGVSQACSSYAISTCAMDGGGPSEEQLSIEREAATIETDSDPWVVVAALLARYGRGDRKRVALSASDLREARETWSVSALVGADGGLSLRLVAARLREAR